VNELLFASPVTLSIGAKLTFDALKTSAYIGGQEVKLLWLVVGMSVHTCLMFVSRVKKEICAGEGLWFRKPFPGVSVTMCDWAKEIGLL
jgi:hypothetical protein